MERQRQTVPIAGINRAENDLTVQDGCCETLHNLRYDAGAWRNVETFRPVAEITDFGGFTLLYKHPATADDLYIASDESGTIHEVCVSGGRLSSTQVIMRGVSELRQTFSFGNVLVFITDGRELYYVLYGNEYVAFDMPEPPDISESKENRSRFKTDFMQRYIMISGVSRMITSPVTTWHAWIISLRTAGISLHASLIRKTKHCCFLPWMANTGSEP